MIESAEEFIRLRNSEEKSEYDRAAMEEAPISVWRDIISLYPDHRKWVAHNNTVPLEILEELCVYEASVREFVAMKRKLSYSLFNLLANDSNAAVRQQIAANKKVPLDLLKKLRVDSDEDVARVANFNFENLKKI